MLHLLMECMCFYDSLNKNSNWMDKHVWNHIYLISGCGESASLSIQWHSSITVLLSRLQEAHVGRKCTYRQLRVFYTFLLILRFLIDCLHLLQSFQNHLKGRTHQLMMDKLEESYKIRVELMRHEQKVWCFMLLYTIWRQVKVYGFIMTCTHYC